MIILAIDSSTPVAGVAIIDKKKIWAESFLNTGYTHSELLMPMIKDTLIKANLKPEEIDAIAVSKGPGSFTGLRIGMVTGKSLAQVLSKKLISVPTLDILAFNLWGQGGIICPILNARKNEVYTALYEMNGEDMVRVSEYMAIGPLDLAEKLKDTGKEIRFLGDGVPIYKELLQRELGFQGIWAPITHLLPKASALGLLGLKYLEEGKEDDIYTLEPLYIRKSEAEVRWEEKACRT